MTEVSSELLRDKLLALVGSTVNDGEVAKLLADLLSCGGGVTLEIEEVRLKLVRREGRFTIKKEDLRRSSLPPRTPTPRSPTR
ncbi:MAG: hypothetical protein ABW321_32785 [Polyangiales bacterium]